MTIGVVPSEKHAKRKRWDACGNFFHGYFYCSTLQWINDVSDMVQKSLLKYKNCGKLIFCVFLYKFLQQSAAKKSYRQQGEITHVGVW